MIKFMSQRHYCGCFMETRGREEEKRRLGHGRSPGGKPKFDRNCILSVDGLR